MCDGLFVLGMRTQGRRSARCDGRGVSYNSECGVAHRERGRAGQAFEVGELGVVDRATANSSPRTATGHKQDDQATKTKPPAGSCSWILD